MIEEASMVKVSVIVPSYKPKDYIWECLDSLRNQTIPLEEYEIIIILNGCNEPYFNLIKNYISRFDSNNIKLFQEDEGGVSNARNVGIDKSRGSYLCFVDDDDYVSPTYLEKLLANVEDCCWPISNIIAFSDGSKEVLPYSISSLFHKVSSKDRVEIMSAREFMSNPVGKLIKRTDIGERRFNKNFVSGEDALFVFSVSNTIKYLKPSGENAIYYRRYRSGSAITSESSLFLQLKNTVKLNLEYVRIYTKHPFSYNFLFFITRLLGGFKTIYARKKLKKKLNGLNQ